MGKIYNHPNAEFGYAIGHVGTDGKVYNHPNAEFGYAIGHVGTDGKVYNHPNAEFGYAIGHVGTDGKVYNHPNAEFGYAIGHVERGCHVYYAGGAALLLLLSNIASHDESEKTYTSHDGRATSTHENNFTSSGTSSSFLGEFVIFFVVLIAIIFAYIMIKAAPVTLFLACGIINMIINGCYGKYVMVNGAPSPQRIAQAKGNSKSWTLGICAVLLAIDILFIVLVSVYLAMYLMFLPIEYWMINTIVWKRMAMGNMRMRPLFDGTSNAGPTSRKTTKAPLKTERTRSQRPQNAKKARSHKKNTYQQYRTNPFHHSDDISNYYTCASCHTILRVPKGRGRIQITCPKCKIQFIVDD